MCSGGWIPANLGVKDLTPRTQPMIVQRILKWMKFLLPGIPGLSHNHGSMENGLSPNGLIITEP